MLMTLDEHTVSDHTLMVCQLVRGEGDQGEGDLPKPPKTPRLLTFVKREL